MSRFVRFSIFVAASRCGVSRTAAGVLLPRLLPCPPVHLPPPLFPPFALSRPGGPSSRETG
eukprot:3115358-Prorocentrum_lima.AAC.1